MDSFLASYALLWLLALMASVIIRRVLRSAARTHTRLIQPVGRLPPFSARIVGSGDSLTHSMVLGGSVAVAFVDAALATTPDRYRYAATSLTYLLERESAPILIVCTGPWPEVVLARYARYAETLGPRLRVIRDDDRSIARAFRVQRVAVVFAFDDTGHLQRLGEMTIQGDGPMSQSAQPA